MKLKQFVWSTSILSTLLFSSWGYAANTPQKINAIGCEGETIETKLACIEGLRFVEDTTGPKPAGYRLFTLFYKQPTDHLNPGVEDFEQKVVLLHKSFEAPMILQTSGYKIFGIALSAIAAKFQANQIQIEHRYFETSTPASRDLSKLTIQQSAADFHRITVALKSIYSGKWVNTGASKGGMTSVYHRRFYPDDLDGTLAVVAPLSYSTDDQRYVRFVDRVGGIQYKTCRARLVEFQKTVLRNKEAITSAMSGTFERLGNATIALEHAVIELPFAFWQYGNPDSLTAGCQAIPAPNASLAEVTSFLNVANNPSDGYGDEGISIFQTYYIQAAFQLGAPAARMDSLSDLLSHQDTYNIERYLPKDADITFDPTVMPEIQAWVKNESKKIMYIYGQFDPWTAGTFKPGAETRDNWYFVVPKGNHGSNVPLLDAPVKAQAWAKLAEWLNVPVPTNKANTQQGETLEELEFKALRKR